MSPFDSILIQGHRETVNSRLNRDKGKNLRNHHEIL